jgi:ATP-dependent protease ClpP protease subunit
MRAIHISGMINRDLVSRITPQILKLQSLNRTPISVYIDSPGGNVGSMETILRLLQLTDQDNSGPCHIITAVTTRAASAAADLLSSGDYAIAFPTSSVLYHGLRQQETNPLTVETTSMLTNILRFSNDIYAMSLARKIEDRFSFRYVMTRDEFDAFRTQNSVPTMSDLDCFVRIVEGKLSNEAKKVWQKAKDRHERYEGLFSTILKKIKRDIPSAKEAQIEADCIKAIVEFELKRNKNDPSWNFKKGGIGQLVDDFFLLNEYLSNYGSERLKKWCTSFGRWILPQSEADEIAAISDENTRAEKLVTKVRPLLQPLWSFFVALCHALQEGENELTATDAYWLGLVDEVVGENLLSARSFEEFKPDPQSKTEQNEEEKAPSEEKPDAATGA